MSIIWQASLLWLWGRNLYAVSSFIRLHPSECLCSSGCISVAALLSPGGSHLYLLLRLLQWPWNGLSRFMLASLWSAFCDCSQGYFSRRLLWLNLEKLQVVLKLKSSTPTGSLRPFMPGLCSSPSPPLLPVSFTPATLDCTWGSPT